MAYLLLSLAATAVAQSPQIESSGTTLQARLGRQGDLRVVRQVETDVAETLARIESTLIPQAINTAQQQAFNATLTAMTAYNAQMLELQNSVNGIQAAVSAQMASLNADVSTQLVAIQATVSTNQDAMRSEITSTLEAADETAQQREVLINQTITNAIAEMESNNRAMNTSVISALASKADSAIHMWTGGCTSHGGSGWREMCLNQAHHNSGMPYFTPQGTRFRNLLRGYYSLTVFAIYRTSGWQYTRTYMSGRNMGHGINREGYHEGGYHWRDAHMTVMWPCTAGSQSWVQMYVDSWNAWHSTNGNGDHSRVTYYLYGKYDEN